MRLATPFCVLYHDLECLLLLWLVVVVVLVFVSLEQGLVLERLGQLHDAEACLQQARDQIASQCADLPVFASVKVHSHKTTHTTHTLSLCLFFFL